MIAVPKSREQSIANYTRGVQFGAERYNAAKGRMSAAWVQSLSQMGVQVSAARQQKYQSGIANAQFRAGSGEEWWNNWVRGLST